MPQLPLTTTMPYPSSPYSTSPPPDNNTTTQATTPVKRKTWLASSRLPSSHLTQHNTSPLLKNTLFQLIPYHHPTPSHLTPYSSISTYFTSTHLGPTHPIAFHIITHLSHLHLKTPQVNIWVQLVSHNGVRKEAGGEGRGRTHKYRRTLHYLQYCTVTPNRPTTLSYQWIALKQPEKNKNKRNTIAVEKASKELMRN